MHTPAYDPKFSYKGYINRVFHLCCYNLKHSVLYECEYELEWQCTNILRCLSMYFQKEIPAVFQIDGVKAMWVFGEEIRRGNAVWLKTEAILITQTVKVNDAFMVIVGHELHTLLREEAEGLIKTWQFKRICPRAFSPYLIQCQLTISSRKIQGVSQYSTEKRPSRYAY